MKTWLDLVGKMMDISHEVSIFCYGAYSYPVNEINYLRFYLGVERVQNVNSTQAKP